MRENSRLKTHRELSIEPRQAFGLLAVALLATGGAFLLGTSIGRASTRATVTAAPAAHDPLARLDQPIEAAGEPAPALQAHQALVDRRPIEKAMPVAAVKPAFPAEKSADADEVLTPPAVTTNSAAPAPLPVAGATAVPEPAPAAGAPTSAGPAPAPVSTAQKVPSSIKSAANASSSAAPSAPGKLPRIAASESRRPALERKRGRYTIQVGAVPHRSDAERLARRLAPRPAQIVTADLPGKGRWYRVQLGSYDSEASARQGLVALARTGVHGMITAVR